MSEGTQTTLGAYHVNGGEEGYEIFPRTGALLLAEKGQRWKILSAGRKSSADVIYLGEAVCSKRRATKNRRLAGNSEIPRRQR